MQRLTSVILLSFFFLSSCKHPVPAPVNLTLDDMYDIDSVRASIASHQKMTVAQQNRLAKAIQLYKVHQSYVHSIDTLRALILEMPTAQAYFELGTVYLLDQDDYQAVNALTVAEKLHYAPLYNVLYELSAAWAKVSKKDGLTGSREKAMNYMQVAIQMGYPVPENFKIDPAFKDFASGNYAFDRVYKIAMSGRRDLSATLFQDYLHGFSDLNAPFMIDTNWINKCQFSDEQSIHFEFEKYVTEIGTAKFSREGGPSFFYVGKLKTDTNYVALIYVVTNNWEVEGQEDSDTTITGPQSNTGDPLYFYLTTYTPQGKIIDKIMVAGHESIIDPTKQFSLISPQEFSITDLQYNYHYNPIDSGYSNNNVDSVTVSSSKVYRITPSGKFEQEAPHPLAYVPSASAVHPGTGSATRQ
jgi:hypothetical protein